MIFKKIWMILLFLTLPFLGFSKVKVANFNLNQWPEGKSPEEIGARVALRFLKPPHSHYKESAVRIHYKTVCTWLGGLWFAEASNNRTLYEEFENNFATVLNSRQSLQPAPDHVDNSVFGSVPLELFLRSKRKDYLDLGLSYADKQWTVPDGASLRAMTFADQGYSWQTRLWVDDMFMITILQVQAFRATGDISYLNRASRQMILYLDKLQLDNGLFYHHPETPIHWGRGNGWFAVGMAEILRYLPESNPERQTIMAGYMKMMEGLLKFQDIDGMWRQIIDDDSAWKETSCTAMFTYAFITGVKCGWLPPDRYSQAARQGWLGLVSYINDNDQLTEICQGTGRGDREHYLNRKRWTGDGHGTAPLLWCAGALMR